MLLILYLLANILCGKGLHGESVFEAVPKSQDVYDGRSLVLQCSLKKSFEGLYILSWLADGEQVKGGRRYVGPNGHLHFESVDKDLDTGKFECVASLIRNPDVKNITDPVYLYIKWLDVVGVLLRLPSSGTDILPGSRVMMKCDVTGIPKPQTKSIVWRLNGTDVQSNQTKFNISKGKLLIEKTELGVYDGSYSCCLPEGNRRKCSLREYILHVRDKSVPVLTDHPKDITVPLSADAMFICTFDSSPPPQVEWFRDGDPIKRKPITNCRLCVLANETLIIKNVKERHQGTYTCKATGSKGSTVSADAKLTIAYIKDFSDPGVELEYLDKGQDLEKVCDPLEAEPHPNITWLRHGQEILPSAGRLAGRVTVSGKTLVIQSAQLADEGDYQCIAKNMAGNVTKTYSFKIKVQPRIRSGLVGRTEREGSDVTLKCLADAVPPPTYTWYQNSTALTTNSHFRILDNQLTIKMISVKDAAEYKCTAMNGYGSATSSAFIRIEEWLKFDPMPTDLCVETHKPTAIVCMARGVKNPIVEWTISPSSNQTKIITSSPANKTLLLIDPKPGDLWTAYCTGSVRNSLDDSDPSVHTIEISVGKRPRIVKPPQDSVIFQGQTVRLDCGLNPEAEISLERLRWKIFVNGTVLEYTVKNNSDSSDKYNVMNNGSFFIRNASKVDSGVYACHYEDCGFEVTQQATLDVAEGEGPIITSTDPDDGDTGGTALQYKKIQTAALAAGCSIAYLILTVTIIVYCRRKKRHKKDKATSSESAETAEENQPMLNGSGRKNRTANKCDQVLLEPVTHLSEDIKGLQYDQKKLDHVTVIGHGEFGEVYLSRAPGIFPDLKDDVLVMVKKLDSNSDVENSAVEGRSDKSIRYEFNREIRLLYRANHENIGKILGVCSEHTSSTRPDYFITEYLEWGILKLCLQASNEGKLQRFSKNVKMRMCYQIAAGLEHLAKLHLCHQDVATRNCLISSTLLVKLSVLSLKKEGFENEYALHKGRLMPIRWMAPEILNGENFSLKSDVWSFGVTCWEIFTLGTLPFSDLSDDHFLEEMQREQLPTLPLLNGSKRMTSLISKCCQRNPSSRPECHQIVKKFDSILNVGTASKKRPTSGINPDAHLYSNSADESSSREDVLGEVVT